MNDTTTQTKVIKVRVNKFGGHLALFGACGLIFLIFTIGWVTIVTMNVSFCMHKAFLLLVATFPLLIQGNESYFYLQSVEWPGWCIDCEFHSRQNGPACRVGDNLLLDECYSGSPRQRFYYEETSNGAGRFKPLGSPGLCFTRDSSSSEVYLDYCDDDNDDQLFSGFDPDSQFELKSDDSNSWGMNSCLAYDEYDVIEHRMCAGRSESLLWEALDVEDACPQVCLELTQDGTTTQVSPITTPQTLEDFYDCKLLCTMSC